MWMWVLTVGGVSTLISGLATGLLRRATRSDSSRWLDQPGTQAHKQHDRAIANIGGIAIFWAIALPWVIALIVAHVLPEVAVSQTGLGRSLSTHLPGLREQSGLAIVILLAAGAMHVLGLIDDRRNLPATGKLLVQLAVCTLAVLLVDLRVLHVLDQFGSIGFGFSVLVTVLWMVVLINAMNMLDNMDGLSSGVAVLCALIFMAVALMAGQWFVAAASASVAGAALGFWLHNRPPARIFMGDGGSLVLGLMLAVISIQATYVIWPERVEAASVEVGTVEQGAARFGAGEGGTGEVGKGEQGAAGFGAGEVGTREVGRGEQGAAEVGSSHADALVQTPGHWHAVLAPLMILAVPLYDFCSVVMLRVGQGRSPLKGDRQHLSHRLLDRGLSTWAALAVMYLLTLATGLGAITLANLPPRWAIVAGVQAACVLAVLAVLEFASRTR